MSTLAVDTYGAGYTGAADSDPLWAEGTAFDPGTNTQPASAEEVIADDTLSIAKDYVNAEVSNRERLVRAILGDAVDGMALQDLISVEDVLKSALNEGLAAHGPQAPEFHLVSNDMSEGEALSEGVEGAFITPEASGTKGGVILLSRDLLADPERLGEVALEELGEALAVSLESEGILQELGLEIAEGDVGERISSTIQEERIEQDTWEVSDSDVTTVNWGDEEIENVAAADTDFARDAAEIIEIFDSGTIGNDKDGVVTIAEVQDKAPSLVPLFTAVMRLYSGGDGKLSQSDLQTALSEEFLMAMGKPDEAGDAVPLYLWEGDFPAERFTELFSAMEDGDVTFAEFRDVMAYMVGANRLTPVSVEMLRDVYTVASMGAATNGTEGNPSAEMIVSALADDFAFTDLLDNEAINVDNLLTAMFGEDSSVSEVHIDDFPEEISAELHVMFEMYAGPDEQVITRDELQAAANTGMISWILYEDGSGGMINMDLTAARGAYLADALEPSLGGSAVDKHSFARAFGGLVSADGFASLSDSSKNAINGLFDKAQAIANESPDYQEGKNVDVRFADLEEALADNELVLGMLSGKAEVFVNALPEPASGYGIDDFMVDGTYYLYGNTVGVTVTEWIFDAGKSIFD